MACVEQHAGYARFCRAAWDHSLHTTVINVADWLLTAPLSVHQVMINGHALCSPISFARGCDPCRPGTAVQWSARACSSGRSPRPCGCPGLARCDSAASHTGPCLRDIAGRRENAAGALER